MAENHRIPYPGLWFTFCISVLHLTWSHLSLELESPVSENPAWSFTLGSKSIVREGSCLVLAPSEHICPTPRHWLSAQHGLPLRRERLVKSRPTQQHLWDLPPARTSYFKARLHHVDHQNHTPHSQDFPALTRSREPGFPVSLAVLVLWGRSR